jgi:hypothetical protein
MANTLLVFVFACFASAIDFSLDRISSMPLDLPAGRPTLGGFARTLMATMPLAFLAPGLAFLQAPVTLLVLAMAAAFLGATCLPRPASALDDSMSWANLLPTLLATLGSLAFALCLQRRSRP